MGSCFSKVAMSVAMLSLLSNGAVVHAVELDFSVETSVEYVTNQLMTKEYGVFEPPFIFEDDARAGVVLAVIGSHQVGPFLVTGAYYLEKVEHIEVSNLDWTMHTGEFSVMTEFDSGASLSLGYQANNGVPDSWFGDVYYDIVTSRLRLAAYKVNDLPYLITPSFSLEWEESDPKLVPPFAWEIVTGEINLQFKPLEGDWTSDFFFGYGHTETRIPFFRHDFLTLEWLHVLPVGERSQLDLDLSFRKEWYEIVSTSPIDPQYDKKLTGSVAYSRPLRDDVMFQVSFEASKYDSGDTGANFLETKTRAALSVSF